MFETLLFKFGNDYSCVSFKQTLTGVNDGQCAHPVVFSAGCAQLNVVPTVVVDTSLGQHGVVLNLRFPVGKQLNFNCSNTL